MNTESQTKKHVVVVTDITRASNLIHCLDDAYQLAVFDNAEAALNHMISNKQKLDIILLNNQLPDARSMELLALLKCNPDLEHIPVVLQATFHNDVALAQLLRVDEHISDDKYDFSAVVKNVYDRRSATLTNSYSYDGTQDNVYVIMRPGESLYFSDPISVVALETGVSTLYASKFTTRTQIDAFKAGANAPAALLFKSYSQVAALICGASISVALECTNWQQFHSWVVCKSVAV